MTSRSDSDKIVETKPCGDATFNPNLPHSKVATSRFKCQECGCEIERFPEIRPGMYCRDFCYACYIKLTFQKKIKNQKFEEIKRMTLRFYQECIVEMECDSCSIPDALDASWHYAEEFYKYAKQKEEEMENNV